jgi:hypothetical protein
MSAFAHFFCFTLKHAHAIDYCVFHIFHLHYVLEIRAIYKLLMIVFHFFFCFSFSAWASCISLFLHADAHICSSVLMRLLVVEVSPKERI